MSAVETKTAGQIMHDLEGRLGEIALAIESAATQVDEYHAEAKREIDVIIERRDTAVAAVEARADQAKAEGQRISAALEALRS